MRATSATRFVCLVAVAAAITACGSNSNSPSNTVGTPAAVSPASGASIAYTAQPVLLTVANASGTSSAATYLFEVATDTGFATKVFSKTTTAGNGQTSVQVDTLSGNTTYYWHARVQDGSTTGSFSGASSFSIGTAIGLSAPVPVSPANGSSSSGWPVLTVTNSVRTGATGGALVYKFEVSTSSSFTSVLVAATVSEGVGQTSYQPSASQSATAGTTYYWRVTAMDTTNNVSSQASAVQNFSYSSLAQGMAALQGLTLWAGVQPPAGSYGHVQISAGWDLFQRYSPIDGRLITSPTLEVLQILDLLDRGLDPDAACNWLQANYGTSAKYYPGIVQGVIGFSYHYMAKTNGQWELVFRVGA